MPQFLMRDDDLENIYDCLKGVGETSDALMVLSKPEDDDWARENVYSDVLILTLTDEQVEELINAIADEDGPAALLVTIARSVKKGLASRESQESDDDDESDEDLEYEYAPGAWGHPLRADGTPHQRHVCIAYCVACREHKEVEGNMLVSDAGRIMIQSNCPDCGTKVNRIFENTQDLFDNAGRARGAL
jgi:hypothetical protein